MGVMSLSSDPKKYPGLPAFHHQAVAWFLAEGRVWDYENLARLNRPWIFCNSIYVFNVNITYNNRF